MSSIKQTTTTTTGTTQTTVPQPKLFGVLEPYKARIVVLKEGKGDKEEFLQETLQFLQSAFGLAEPPVMDDDVLDVPGRDEPNTFRYFTIPGIEKRFYVFFIARKSDGNRVKDDIFALMSCIRVPVFTYIHPYAIPIMRINVLVPFKYILFNGLEDWEKYMSRGSGDGETPWIGNDQIELLYKEKQMQDYMFTIKSSEQFKADKAEQSRTYREEKGLSPLQPRKHREKTKKKGPHKQRNSQQNAYPQGQFVQQVQPQYVQQGQFVQQVQPQYIQNSPYQNQPRKGNKNKRKNQNKGPVPAVQPNGAWLIPAATAVQQPPSGAPITEETARELLGALAAQKAALAALTAQK